MRNKLFIGDSITCKFNKQYKDVFDKYFKNGALALGASGDTFAGLHWRIRHGEVPNELNPAIWWIHIGTNNMKFTCDYEEITLGIMHIAEEIRSRKPDAIIVVNAILPRSDINSAAWDKIKKVNRELILSVNSLNDDDVYFFDLYRDFYDKSLYNIKKGLHADTIHLSANGYEIRAKRIVEWTKENLNIDLPY